MKVIGISGSARKGGNTAMLIGKVLFKIQYKKLHNKVQSKRCGVYLYSPNAK